ncbi:hypothetical protein [Sphingomonas alpina]|uniref:Copper chaperone PCu(A)C n=1 Tax=Sphingomonas alpina TaxID=653931 RepID=A0A7H0LER9_9SPHN|nr:hypothetical protein [Sphingomonas alpina]QNQ08172.1 hypothetical protein H3Z74_15540 [Sphingomonas alpina]
MIRRLSILLATVALTACTPEKAGPMAPVADPGITIAKDGKGSPAAQLAAGPLSLTVSGRWADRGSQTLLLRYHNGAATPVSITITGLTLDRAAQRMPLRSVTDVTAADSPTYNPDTDSAALFSVESPGIVRALTVAPGATRTITAEFGPPAANPAVAAGQTFTARVAVPGRAVPIRFTTKTDSWF